MKVQSNSYTFLYSTIVVLIVATGLAIFSTALRPAQTRNVELEKKQNILSSLRVKSDRATVEKLYTEYIKDSYTVNYKGDKVIGIDPFKVNLREELKKSPSKRNLPAFEATKNDSSFLVIPVYGKGLWGPIWGYMSFQKEATSSEGLPHFNTIYGVTFDHKGETPGLGAEINQPFFQVPFRGKKIFDDEGVFVSVDVVKGGANPISLHEVDGISGGTITSKGLEAMIDSCLVSYQNYFKLNN
ncbi:MAG: NADH:ubiquinone reductase (Na(+)-transporting) subunit C [Bacteroidales bacterium]|nr:NADH:ubiquinone reductase (Na(+)-transporting) subunit C [Bacteroidales bacterium]